MAGFNASIIGGKELKQLLGELGKTKARAAIRKGTRQGSKIIAHACRNAIPAGTPPVHWNKSIKVRAMKKHRTQTGTVVQVGKGWFVGETFYAAFAEFGHKKPLPKVWREYEQAKGRSAGAFVEGKHYMQHATESVADAAMQVAVARIKYEIEGVRMARLTGSGNG